MKFIEKNLGDIDHCNIIPLSDIHVGDSFFNEKKYLKMIKWIENNKDVYVTLGGDLINNAIIGSVSDIYGEVKTPSQAKKWVVNSLMPIKDRILGVVRGNHENRSKKLTDWDITEDIASELDAPYNAESLYINIKLGNYRNRGRVNYTMFLNHGAGGGSTPGGRANSVYKANKIVLADLYVVGHYHNMITFPDTIFVPDLKHRRLEQIKRMYVVSGSYTEYGGYAEDAMFAPGKTGCPRIYLSGTSKNFHVSI